MLLGADRNEAVRERGTDPRGRGALSELTAIAVPRKPLPARDQTAKGLDEPDDSLGQLRRAGRELHRLPTGNDDVAVGIEESPEQVQPLGRSGEQVVLRNEFLLARQSPESVVLDRKPRIGLARWTRRRERRTLEKLSALGQA